MISMSPKRNPERRLRIRRESNVHEGYAKMNPKAMKYLKIDNKVEVVIGGSKRITFKVLSSEDVPENEVWCNEDELRTLGISDKTIATCRAPLKKEKL